MATESEAGRLLRSHGEKKRLREAIEAELSKIDKARTEVAEAEQRYNELVSASSELEQKGGV